MSDIKNRIVAVAKRKIGPTAAQIVSESDIKSLESFIDNWSDLDVCWFAVYPHIYHADSRCAELKNELLACVWNHCSNKRGMTSSYPALQSMQNTLDLLTEVVIGLFSTPNSFPRFLGFSAFCNLVFWRMNKRAISVIGKKSAQTTLFEDDTFSTATDSFHLADSMIKDEQELRLAELIQRLPLRDQQLMTDYQNKVCYAELCERHAMSESALRKRVQRIVDRLRADF
ncbi:MAG: sigma-70 family RNA polymerase sigma factor [Planctomycetes bacterium]|nr:sigma-70 family RNA polymerase sigma factor [Planctomycetota bacterium]